ncbi:hypothetical protein KQI82_03600 [Oscillibacter sp. MSJ-2]|uniref:Uncharacterized protein n=1 Tax=Dysosmobacter acutus TaxID=2841504 RepID=A0ABS6F6W9_9FIRM|nr:hypothetical protein [Dysosmobacter acutus]MBU5626025.1 hypothetical protein [Dysosmobacter acutus]
MAKKTNPASSRNIRKGNAVFHASMAVFLAGCAAEIYLLFINKYLVDGTLDQVLAMAEALPYVIYAGLGVLALGLVLLALWWKRGGALRKTAAWIAGVGAFVAGATFVCLHYVADGTRAMCVAVPVVMLLGVVFLLYQRECFFSVGSLSLALIALYACRRSFSPNVKIAVCVLIAVLALIVVLVRMAEKNGGRLKDIRLFAKETDYLPVYGSIGLSAASLAVTLIVNSAAYYAMWLLGAVLFALAVYYTVKQL